MATRRFPFGRIELDKSIPAVSKDTKQIQEQVDEVEIEAQGTHRCDLAQHRRVGLGAHALDGLRVPCGEAHKDEHTSTTDEQFKH